MRNVKSQFPHSLIPPSNRWYAASPNAAQEKTRLLVLGYGGIISSTPASLNFWIAMTELEAGFPHILEIIKLDHCICLTAPIKAERSVRRLINRDLPQPISG
jgi:hypothetical protein